MFKRRWKWFGPLVSDEGFTLTYSHNTVLYTDPRGTFAFGFEDGVLFPTPFQVKGEPLSIEQLNLDGMIDRIVRGIQFQGNEVEVYQS
jgi:hypothetical protein